MAAPPLTHHDILALAAPFARTGRHVDLGATDRLARRVVFRIRTHAACAPLPEVHEALVLEPGETQVLRLTRTLTTRDGLRATLVVESNTAADALARVDAVPLARQIHATDGYALARSYRVAPGPDARLVLTRAQAKIAAIDLTLEVSRVGGIPAELLLAAAPGTALALPEDFLAVLGWPWTRIAPGRDGWRGSVRLRGEGATRTADAEAKLDRTCAHIAACLAESPQRFHERYRLARWRVAVRCAVPLLVCIGALGATLGMASLDLAENSVWRMLMFHAPPLLLLLYVVLPEMPRIGLPPLPRRPAAPAWQLTQPAAGAGR
jgi:hypothetical protein